MNLISFISIAKEKNRNESPEIRMKCLTKTFLKIYNFGQLYNDLSSCMKEKTIFLDRETVRDSLFQLWKLYKKIMRKMLRIIFYKK